MAKGSQAKEEIFEKLLNTFEGAFMADSKTLRIPWSEAGEKLEIKVTLTAAKDLLGEASAVDDGDFPSVENKPVTVAHEVHASEQEKEDLKLMMEKLGL